MARKETYWSFTLLVGITLELPVNFGPNNSSPKEKKKSLRCIILKEEVEMDSQRLIVLRLFCILTKWCSLQHVYISNILFETETQIRSDDKTDRLLYLQKVSSLHNPSGTSVNVFSTYLMLSKFALSFQLSYATNINITPHYIRNRKES